MSKPEITILIPSLSQSTDSFKELVSTLLLSLYKVRPHTGLLATYQLSPTLLYHIHPDRSRGRNVSFPTSTLTFPYYSLPYRPNTPTLRYPSTSYLSTLLPSHPIHSAHLHCPNTLSCCTLSSPPLSSNLLSSPTSPYPIP